MQTLTLSIEKSNIYNEVAKTTSYIGAKADDAQIMYDRVFTTDDDKALLERYYNEALSTLLNALKRVCVITDKTLSTNIEITASGHADGTLLKTLDSTIQFYLVNYIVAKWSEVANKAEVDRYSATAASLLKDIVDKVFYKVRPTRKKV